MRIGSRGSALALAQSTHVRSLLPGSAEAHELEIIETSGDRNPMASLQRIGGKGVFTKEIEEALLMGRIDLAVHSLKDLPTDVTPGLVVAALLPREDPRDALISRGGAALSALPTDARIGTSSLRRRSQLLAKRPDLSVSDMRGNVPTRLARLEEGRFDAIVVAAAGLNRLGLSDRVTELIDESVMLPAPGQGVLAIQIREGDERTTEAIRALHHAPSASEAIAERAMLAGLGGGCLVPIGARARARGDRMTLAGFVGHPSGRPFVRLAAEGPVEAPEALGRSLAAALLAQGAREILNEVRSDEVFP
jgi:hydroxymethylbilane synthase